MSEKVLKVLANCAQGLTEEQKAQARANIGCADIYTAGDGITINGDVISNTSPNVQADWNAATGTSAEILNKPILATVAMSGNYNDLSNKPSVPDIKTVTTTLPPVETDVSSMTLFEDGRVRVNNSTEVGLLAPTGVQADNGKVLVGSYVGSPGKFVANWGDVSALVSAYPQIDYMTHVTYNVNLSAANYLNMEDGVCYDVMSNAGGSFTLHLQTNSTTTIHSKIYLWGEQSNCMSATVVYEDEGGEVSELQFVYGGTSANTLYALDVYARKVHVSGGISFDAYLCRVYDYPCASRDINSYNKDIGRVVEYVEPL